MGAGMQDRMEKQDHRGRSIGRMAGEGVQAG